MWLLQGRFGEETRVEQAKLLKYGESYVLGRKIPADIVVESKFVSRTACTIAVGTLDPAQQGDVEARPKVTISFEPSKSRQAFSIQRPDRDDPGDVRETLVPAEQTVVLEDGHSFVLTTTISLKLVWRPLAICFASKVKDATIRTFSEGAHKLGIHLSSAKSKWKDGYTHLCVTQIKPTETVLSALIQARPIISPAYVEELLRLGSLPRHDEHSLETVFREPDPATFLPDASKDDFVGAADLHQQLQPDQVRPFMFSGTTCVFLVLPEDLNEFSIYRSILSLGGAQVLSHNPLDEGLHTQADFTKLLMPYRNRAISYRKNSHPIGIREAPDDGLVVLCNSTHDGEAWRQSCAIACANLQIPMPSGFHVITSAICNANARSSLNVVPSLADVGLEPEAEVAARITDADGLGGGAEPRAPTRTIDADLTRAETSAPEEQLEAVRPPASEAISAQDQARASATVVAPQNTAAAAEPLPPVSAGPSARRPLRRRTNRTNILDEIYGSDAPLAANSERDDANQGQGSGDVLDAAQGLNGEPTVVSPQSQAADPTSAVPSTSSRRAGTKLVRRTGADGARSRRSDIFDNLLHGSIHSADLRDGGGDSQGGDSLATQGGGGGIPRSKRYRLELDEEDRRMLQSLEPDVAEGFSADAQRPAHSTMDESTSSAAGDGPDALASRATRASDRAGGPTRLKTVPEHDAMENTGDDLEHARATKSTRQPRKRTAADHDLASPEAEGTARKRQRSTSVVDLGDAEAPAPGVRPSTTTTDARTADRVIRRSPSEVGRAGLEQSGHPDTEPQFLQALNTQKSRRKKMDHFDDEFNRLKITKPHVIGQGGRGSKDPTMIAAGAQTDKFVVDEDFEAFKLLAEEELRIDVRGNFVQVDFVPLMFKKRGEQPCQTKSAQSGHADLEAVPNFKKFKPKSQRQQQQQQQLGQAGCHERARREARPPIAMQLTEANDYGIGEAYWKGPAASVPEVAAAANRIEVDGEQMDLIEPPPRGGRVRSTNINLVLSDDSEADAPTRRPKPGAKPAKRAAAAASVEAPMALDGDMFSDSGPVPADLDLTGLDSDEDDISMLASRAVTAPTRTRNRAPQASGKQAVAASQSNASSHTARDGSRDSSITAGGSYGRGQKRGAADDGDALMEIEEEDDEPPRAARRAKVPTSAPPRKRSKTSTANGLVVPSSSDDDDDDGVYHGGGADENDGNFAGFGASTSARTRRAATAAAAGDTQRRRATARTRI